MSNTLFTQANAIKAAGKGANATIVADSTQLTLWSDQAEGRIEAETRRTWVDDFASLDTGTKGLLQEVGSAIVAMKIITWDTSGYFNSREAETLLDYLDDVVNDGLRILKDFKANTLRSAI